MDRTQTDTGQPDIIIRTRSGKCRWYRINAPIYIAIYYCLEGRTIKQTAWAVFGHQHVHDSSARNTNLSRLSETPDSDKLGDDGTKSNSNAVDASVHRPPSPKPEKRHSVTIWLHSVDVSHELGLSCDYDIISSRLFYHLPYDES
jgi:hypothetical protein